jgi:predicted transcriptional regulator of viral defense system
MARSPSGPRWDQLYDVAAEQEGLFTARQAVAAGYSLPLLAKYLRNGKVQHLRRGIYRLVHFPPGEHEDLVALWLWSDRVGVFSHESALSLHELSDVLPRQAHMTVPLAWQKRRLRVPQGAVLHYGDLRAADRTWIGPLPVTSVSQTLRDSVEDHVAPELVGEAFRQAVARGMVARRDIADVESALRRTRRTRR